MEVFLMAGLVGLVFLGTGLLLMVKGQAPSRTLAVPAPTITRPMPQSPSTPSQARISVPVRRVPAYVAVEDDEYEAPTELISAAGLRELLDQVNR